MSAPRPRARTRSARPSAGCSTHSSARIFPSVSVLVEAFGPSVTEAREAEQARPTARRREGRPGAASACGRRECGVTLSVKPKSLIGKHEQPYERDREE